MNIWLQALMACVRAWTKLYTSGLPPAVRNRRRAEIDSDLWEWRADQASEPRGAAGLHLLLRMLRGMPHDVAWRVELGALGRVPHRGLTVIGQILGAGIVFCAMGVIHLDAIRKQPAVPFARADPPAFEAASVKVNRSGQASGGDRVLPGGRYVAENLPLIFLVRFAYERSPRSRGLAPADAAGGPAWLRSDRFDINATAGRDVSLTELRLMLQTLFEDRFKLKVHFETREMPVYRMVLAKAGTLGSQLHRTTADCAGAPFDPLRGTAPGQSYPCGYFGFSPNVTLGSGRAYQAFRGMTMEDFGRRLHEFLGRPVIDGTGLAAYFDGDFEFTTEIVMPPPPPGQANPYDGRVLPSIFSVMPQQLGLRLDAERGPGEILVIDRVEHPSED
jgi:uncharacterized protein (TIGR03435 family)